MYSFTYASHRESIEGMRQVGDHMQRQIRELLEQKNRVVQEIEANKRIEAQQQRRAGEKEVFDRTYAFLLKSFDDKMKLVEQELALLEDKIRYVATWREKSNKSREKAKELLIKVNAEQEKQKAENQRAVDERAVKMRRRMLDMGYPDAEISPLIERMRIGDPDALPEMVAKVQQTTRAHNSDRPAANRSDSQIVQRLRRQLQRKEEAEAAAAAAAANANQSDNMSSASEWVDATMDTAESGFENMTELNLLFELPADYHRRPREPSNGPLNPTPPPLIGDDPSFSDLRITDYDSNERCSDGDNTAPLAPLTTANLQLHDVAQQKKKIRKQPTIVYGLTRTPEPEPQPQPVQPTTLQNDDGDDLMCLDKLELDEHDQLELDRMTQEFDSDYEEATPAPPSVPTNTNPATDPNTSIIDLISSTLSGTSGSDDDDNAPTGVHIPSPQANTGAVRKKTQPDNKSSARQREFDEELQASYIRSQQPIARGKATPAQPRAVAAAPNIERPRRNVEHPPPQTPIQKRVGAARDCKTSTASAAVVKKTAKPKPTVANMQPNRTLVISDRRPAAYVTIQEEQASMLRRQYEYYQSEAQQRVAAAVPPCPPSPPTERLPVVRPLTAAERRKRAEDCDRFIERYARRNPDVVIPRSTVGRNVQVAAIQAHANSLAAVVQRSSAPSTATSATVAATNQAPSYSRFMSALPTIDATTPGPSVARAVPTTTTAAAAAPVAPVASAAPVAPVAPAAPVAPVASASRQRRRFFHRSETSDENTAAIRAAIEGAIGRRRPTATARGRVAKPKKEPKATNKNNKK